MSDRGLQDPGLTFSQLYDQARASLDSFSAHGNSLAAGLRNFRPDLFADASFSQGPLKGLDRAEAKLGQFKGNPREIVDLVRGRIVLDTPEQIQAARQFLETHGADSGIEVIKDRFAKPSDTHYRDINLRVRLPNGHVSEIQINQRDLLAASEFTHKSYEDVQAIERRAEAEGRDLTPDERVERQKLLDYTRDTHDLGAARATGVDTLLNDEGRAKLETSYSERLARDPAFQPGVTLEAGTRYGVPALDTAKAYGGPGFADPSSANNANPLSVRASEVNAPEGSLRGFWDKAADWASDLGKRSGLLGGAIIGTAAAGATYMATGSTAEAATVGYESIVPYGETQLDVAGGDLNAAARSATVETAATAGSIGGALAGAAAGAAIGSVVPVVGTIAGGIAGGIIGGIGGGVAVGSATDFIIENGQSIANGTMTAIENTGSAIAGGANYVWSGITGLFNDKAAPDQQVTALAALDAEEIQSNLQSLSEDQIASLSPEMQSLYQVRENTDLFGRQLSELQEHGGINEITEDVETIASLAAEAEQDKPANLESLPPAVKTASAPSLS